MRRSTLREQLEDYVKEKYNVVAEQLPFNHEDYAVFRHENNGKWFAVFIVKARKEFGLDGEGLAQIVSLKVKDSMLADLLTQQPGYMRGYLSIRWNWVSIVLDGSVPFEDICHWVDESYSATASAAKNKKVSLTKRER